MVSAIITYVSKTRIPPDQIFTDPTAITKDHIIIFSSGWHELAYTSQR